VVIAVVDAQSKAQGNATEEVKKAKWWRRTAKTTA
jgi:hypothetical protein